MTVHQRYLLLLQQQVRLCSNWVRRQTIQRCCFEQPLLLWTHRLQKHYSFHQRCLYWQQVDQLMWLNLCLQLVRRYLLNCFRMKRGTITRYILVPPPPKMFPPEGALPPGLPKMLLLVILVQRLCCFVFDKAVKKEAT